MCLVLSWVMCVSSNTVRVRVCCILDSTSLVLLAMWLSLFLLAMWLSLFLCVTSGSVLLNYLVPNSKTQVQDVRDSQPFWSLPTLSQPLESVHLVAPNP